MSSYPKREKAKEAILEIGRRMYHQGFVAANDGNISVRIGKDAVLATPSGVSKGFMKKKILVVTDLEGNLIEGNGKPSSELKMHLRAYKEDDGLRSVCHAHPPFCTAFSIMKRPLDLPMLAEAVITLGDVPVTPYAELGSEEVPEAIAPYVRTHNGVILGNHGAVTWADDPFAAFYRLESMEYYAKITFLTDCLPGERNLLEKEEVERLILMREKFGIRNGGYPKWPE
ncbi:MAG: class II aldolase/adducin family protein [Lachnospiraceae bacterium]|nr:class II aldolase/adducin family protein [Lachnospiraceae bacterium]